MTIFDDLQTLIANATADSAVLDDIISTLQQQATISFALSSSTVLENVGTHIVNVTLTLPSGMPSLFAGITVPITVSPSSTASTPGDYTLSTSSPIVFAQGSLDGATQPVYLNIASDTANEADETIILELGTISGPGQVGTINSHTVTITSLWCGEWDFQVSPFNPGTWIRDTQYNKHGEHADGEGWQTNRDTVSGISDHRIYIELPINPTATITSVEVHYCAPSNAGSGRNIQIFTNQVERQRFNSGRSLQAKTVLNGLVERKIVSN